MLKNSTLKSSSLQVWLITVAAIILQVVLKFSYDDLLDLWSERVFHTVWMTTLYISLTTLIIQERVRKAYKILYLVQFLTPVLLSFFIPRMHLVAILALPWALTVRMKLLLSRDRWQRWFDWALGVNIIVSVVLFFYDGPEEIRQLSEYIFFEILSNLLTLGLVIWVFRIYVLELRNRINEYREKAWHHKWYYSLMLHLGHNLRTPLAAVNTNLEVVSFIAKDEKVKKSVERALEGGDKLKKMVNSLINASNINHIKEDGDTVFELLQRFVAESEKVIDLEIKEEYLTGIKGPEIVSFIMALDAFSDNSFRHGASQVKITMLKDQLFISDNGPGLPKKIKDGIEDTSRTGQSHEGFGSSLFFIMTLLRESGWHVELVEWQQGVTFKLQRSIQNWAQKAIS